MPSQARLQADNNPIAPPLTESPRTTLTGFINDMNLAYSNVMKVYERGKSDPGLRYSPSLRHFAGHAEEAIERAIETLDLSEVAPERRRDVGMESVLLLKEILDRLDLPKPDSIPGLSQVEAEQIERWFIPYSELSLQRLETGVHKGHFLFSSHTITRLKYYYDEIKDFPYTPNASEGFYDFYISQPGSIIPPKWSYFLPKWSTTLIWDQTIWQWFFSATVWLIIGLLIYLFKEHSQKFFRRYNRSQTAWFDLSLPAVFLMGLSFSEYAINDVINFTGIQLAFTTTLHVILNFMSLTWLVLLIFNAIGLTLTHSLQDKGSRLEAAMVRNGCWLLGGMAGATVIAIGFTRLGFSLAPLLASLGAGSLALSLGLQAYIRDMVGGITIFMDQSIEIGDLCEFGSIKGTVEDISLRATTLRTCDHDLVVVPNSQMSSFLINYSRRDKYRFEHHVTIPIEVDRTVVEHLIKAIRVKLSTYEILSQTDTFIDGLSLSDLKLKVSAEVLTADAHEYSQLSTQILLDLSELLREHLGGGSRLEKS